MLFGMLAAGLADASKRFFATIQIHVSWRGTDSEDREVIE
jgi:hypothetical protein